MRGNADARPARDAREIDDPDRDRRLTIGGATRHQLWHTPLYYTSMDDGDT